MKKKPIIEITVTFIGLEGMPSNKYSLLELYKRFKDYGMPLRWLEWFKDGCVSKYGIIWAGAHYKQS